ncbi:MAG: uridine kinase [Shewanellaceae bacterium]|nr:uridine kinase [Shewanellaceae bacterium]
MNQKKCIIIAIAGASASGKSLIAKTIYQELKQDLGTDDIAVINEDSYYRDQGHLSPEQRQLTNYDHPRSLDHDLLKKHLKMLMSGESVEVPVYDYALHTRAAEVNRLSPKKVIILEGILLLTDVALRELIDSSIFMDTPLDICLVRRLVRDVEERGRTMATVLEQYQQTVRPMFLQFIEPSKQHADIIVPRGGKNRIAIEILKARIQHLLTPA